MKAVLAAAWLVVVACGKRSASEEPAGPRTQIIYSLDLDAAVDERATILRHEIGEALAEQKLRADVRLPRLPVGAVTVVPEDPASKAAIDELLRKRYPDLEHRRCEPHDGPEAVCVRVSADHVDALKRAALKNAASTIRRRLEAVEVASPKVHEKGDQIVVSFTSTSDEQRAAVRRLIARSGKLEFKVVDDGAEYMKRLHARVGAERPNGDPTDPSARRAEIRAEIDQWHADDGATHVDHYLIARDRTEQARRRGCMPPAVGDTVDCITTGRMVIERYVQELAHADPSFLVPGDREIGYELVYPDADAVDQHPAWRTYFLERDARLTGAAIADATGSTDPSTDAPIVLLDFNRAGARTFEQLTSEIVGKKLATILDGTIKSAPIIMDPIRGGRAAITMGGGDRRRQAAERDDLVTVFRAGSLPVRLYEESVTTLGP